MAGVGSFNCWKNTMCVGFGVMVLAVTSIFVAHGFYNHRVDKLIAESTLLTDDRYMNWATFPGSQDATLTHDVTLYHTDIGRSQSVPLDPVSLDFSFQYTSITFSQGDQGFIRYLDNWQRKGNPADTPVTTLNPAAQKLFKYESVAPEWKRFGVTFNQLWETIRGMLKQYYAQYIHEFFLKDKQLVVQSVFTEAGLTQEQAEELYENEQYGWGQWQTAIEWVSLTNSPIRDQLPFYETMREVFGLSDQAMQRLVGDRSVLNKLSQALNGTMKSLAESKSINFQCDEKQCSEDQLISLQLWNAFLTNMAPMYSVNLHMQTNQFNASLPNSVELKAFCNDDPDLQCPDKKVAVGLFARQALRNYTILKEIWKNLDDPEALQKTLKIDEDSPEEGAFGASMSAYIDYLDQSVLNATGGSGQAYSQVTLHHLYINQLVRDMQEVLNVELHARAFYNLNQQDKIKCEDFFKHKEYLPYRGLCNGGNYAMRDYESVRRYVQAYLFVNRDKFVADTKMKQAVVQDFLKFDKEQSLFASRMDEVTTKISTALGCATKRCTAEELTLREWSGDNSILNNLPEGIFPEKKVDILDWDIEYRFNGYSPQYHQIMGKKLSLDEAKVLLGNSEGSILSLFSLFSIRTSADSGTKESAELVSYVQRAVLNCQFGGPFLPTTTADLLNGHEPRSIKTKRNQDSMIGGTPWISPKTSSLELSHTSKSFSKVDTGIYNRDRLRVISEVEGSRTAATDYIVFEGQYDHVTEPITTNKSIKGTNMQGFLSDVPQHQSLFGLLEDAHQAITLSYSSKGSYQNVKSYKYEIVESGKPIYVGTEEVNERTLTINPNSYVFVNPTTGLTLAMNITYQVSSAPFFVSPYYSSELNTYQSILLYELTVNYNRDTAEIKDIEHNQSQLRILTILSIVVASLCLAVVVSSIICLRRHSLSRSKQLGSQLLSEENVAIQT